ncbi:hypothetical protein L7F22_063470 [Adiantum nelumboides]|nr:hypothetical protein [Adiantum nelumboides]
MLAPISLCDKAKERPKHGVLCSPQKSMEARMMQVPISKAEPDNGVDMAGADWALIKLMGLHPSDKRLMMYQQGCFTGGTVLCIAKDLTGKQQRSPSFSCLQ